MQIWQLKLTGHCNHSMMLCRKRHRGSPWLHTRSELQVESFLSAYPGVCRQNTHLKIVTDDDSKHRPKTVIDVQHRLMAFDNTVVVHHGTAGNVAVKPVSACMIWS